MSAYNNVDWAECYDLWVRILFGDGPVEDIPVFSKILQSTIDSSPSRSSPITVVDIGTGSGRVPVHLLNTIQKNTNMSFEVWGTEPSSAMLDRAKRAWDEATKSKKDVKVMDHWVQCGATDFASHLLNGVATVDLILFAAGGIAHVTSNADILTFFDNVKHALKPDGTAVVSILRDFIPASEGRELKGALSEPTSDLPSIINSPMRIRSVDHPDLVYIKYPATESMKGGIKTERFRLDVKDEKDVVIRTHELSWDEKMFDKEFWENSVREKGLKVREVIEGRIQIWYILEHASSAENETATTT